MKIPKKEYKFLIAIKTEDGNIGLFAFPTKIARECFKKDAGLDNPPWLEYIESDSKPEKKKAKKKK